jgi:DNA repair photolyase
MIIKEIQSKTCLTKSKITDYAINPYTGCQHGCVYCYAVFMKRFQDIQEPWGDFVYIKKNCVELLKKEFEKNRPGHIWLSSVCDCYMPLEKEQKLTRKILETIAGSPHGKKFTLEVITKSVLVKRDFDLLKQLNASLGLSINCLDAKAARIIEPLASPPLERLEIMKEARQQGIEVFAFISPVLPGLTNLDAIFRQLSFCRRVWVELLNTKKSVLIRLMPVINRYFPEKAKYFHYSINHPEEYYLSIRKTVKALEKKYRIKVMEIIRHGAY